ncbi:MAG: TonB-dependent receptor [Kangiellaceae bacterium]|nr:TonB-dependent receptor [Kangiellaceae bacterium]
MNIHAVLLFVTPILIPLHAEINLAQSDEDNTDKINRVTITSSLIERPLREVNGNLHQLDNESLALIEHEHINQSFVQVPGGWISRGNGQEHLTAIRSPILTGTGGCGAFYIAQDGISLRAPGFCNANQLFDANTEQASSIEVLRGPASTLYGSNAVHGVINILTSNPFEQIESDINITVGSHDYLGTDISFGMQSGNQAFQIYGNTASDGGYKDDSGFDQQKLNLVHQYEHQQLNIKTVLAMTNLNQETAGFISGERAYRDQSIKGQNPNPEAYRDAQSFRAYSQIAYSFDEQSKLIVTPNLRWNEMEFLQHYLPWQPVENNQHQSVGAKVLYQKKINQFDWLFGFDLDLTQGELTEFQQQDFSPTIAAGLHYDYQVNSQTYSPFSQLKWSVSDLTQLTLGGRFEGTEFDYDNNLTDGDACEVGVENCRFTRPADQRVSFQNFSYQLGINHHLANNQRIYGQLSTGHRSPQATELFRLQAGQTIADLKSEKINAFEIGTRGQLGDLFYDLNLFTMKKRNFIFQDSNRQNISNGETSHQGIEFAFNYQLTANLYSKINATIASHKYDSSLTLSRTDIKNNHIDTAPKHMGSFQLGWKSELGNTLELEWVHLGKYYLNPENAAEYAGHDLLNLRVFARLTEQLSINARLLNLTDVDYAERADFGFGSYRYFVGEPRSFFASIKYSFD